MALKVKSAILLILLLASTHTFAQVAFDTVPNSTLQIRGELKIIANSIVGLNQSIEDFFCSNGFGTAFTPNDDYDGRCSNNQRTFGYIDVDGFVDEDGNGTDDTFSSSTADLALNNVDCAEIAYAGLYWAASYYVDRYPGFPDFAQYTDLPGTDTRPDFRTLKFKPPGVANYIDIPASTTQVIYDGYPNTATNSNQDVGDFDGDGNTTEPAAAIDMPYVCYADVTTIVQSLANPEGTYAIGNMRAGTGFSSRNSNGISGGWVLVIAYEDPTLSAKYISTSSGYLNIQPGDPATTFDYNDFETLPEPNLVRARYAIATLEGDQPFTGDIFQVTNVAGGQTDVFTTPANPSGNFFDSSITVDGNYVTTRNPASENTLGFDADIFDIPNPVGTDGRNTVIGNNQTSAEFTTTSSGDAYSVFFNSFQIEVIEPELVVKKRVLEAGTGTDITGMTVDFGDRLFYELTIENQGNESITMATIRDVLPANVDFELGSIVADPGLTVVYDAALRQLDIDIDDSVIERFDGPISMRFEVSVVATCADLRDACSNEIRNIAISSYRGVISDTPKTGETSILDQDPICNTEIAGASNFLINDGICFSETQPAFICTGATTLTAGAGFTNYEWVNVADPGTVIGTSQTLDVTVAGTYRVTKTGTPGCQDGVETFVVDAFTTVTNPVVDIAGDVDALTPGGEDSDPSVNGNIRTCPITGDPLPELFLCGAGTDILLDSGFTTATNIVWQRLDPSACTGVTRDPNCPTNDSACEPSWTTVGTGRTFNLDQAGEYRIQATFDSSCTIPFYFNVFQNNFDPDLRIIRDIICATPGTLRVQNSSLQYEYQLVTPGGSTIGYQDSPEFTGLTEEGTYTVNVRQNNGLPTACVFQDTQFMEDLEATITIASDDPLCPTDQGEIRIQVTDSRINYTYNISSTTGTYTDSEGPTTDPNHIFRGLNPDLYDVEILSFDGSCMDTRQVRINDAATFSATTRLVQDISCNPDFQPDPRLNDPMDPLFDPAALPFDPDEFIGIYEVTVTGGSGAYTFNDQMDFLGTNLAPIAGTTFQFRVTTNATATYSVYVSDNATNCVVFAGSEDFNAYEELTATATGNNPACPTENGSIDVVITAGTANGPFTYILDGTTTIGPLNDTTFTFNNVDPDPAINHVVTVQDRFGCDVETLPVTFTTPALIVATIDEDFRLLNCNTVPVNADQAQAQVTSIVGGSGNYEYSLSPTGVFTAAPAVPFEINFASAGSFTLYIRNAVTEDCVQPFAIEIDPLVTVDSITVTDGAQDCDNQTTAVTLSTTPALIAPNEYLYTITPNPVSGAVTNSNQTNHVFANGVTYTITARNSVNQCTRQITDTPPLVDEITISSATQTSEVTCQGGNDGAFSFGVTNSASFTYTVSGPAPGPLPGPTGPVVVPATVSTTSPIVVESPATPLVAGVYTILVEDNAGNCEFETTVEITEPANDLTLSNVTTNTDCSADTGTITATAMGGRGTYQFQLIDDGTSLPVTGYAYPNTNNVFTGLAAGNYTVFVRDGNSSAACETSAPAVVGQFVPPTLTLATGGDVCFDGDLASQWVTITPNAPIPPTVGPFEYTVTGPVAVSDIPVTFLTGPAPANTFEIPNLTPGNYTVTVTNTETNCVTTPPLAFTINPELTITATLAKDIDCTGDASITFVPAGGTTTYTRFDLYEAPIAPSTTPTVIAQANIPVTGVTVDTAGDYVVGVEDSAGCVAFSNTITVTDFVAVLATLTPTNPTCPGDTDGSIEVTVTAGQGPFTYVLDGDVATQIGPTGDTTVTFNNVDDTPNPHVVTITDGSRMVAPLCTFNFNTILTDPAVIVPTIGIARELSCNVGTEDAIIEITGVIGGSGSYAYTLDPATGYTNIAVFPVNIPITTAGTYTVYVANQATPETCPITTEVIIAPKAEVTDLDFNPDPVVCTMTTPMTPRIVLTPTLTGVGTVDEYEITAPAGAVTGPQASNEFNNLEPGTYTFLARTDDGCEYTENFVIEDIDQITVTATPVNEPRCNGESTGELSFTVGTIDIPATATYEYEITGGTPVITPITATGQTTATITTGDVLPVGDYTITVTDEATGCEAMATVTIGQPDALTITSTPVVALTCVADATITVNTSGGNGGNMYTLRDSGGAIVTGPQSSNVFSVSAADTYTIEVEDSLGCMDDTTQPVVDPPTLAATLNASSDLCLSDGMISFDVDIDAVNAGLAPYRYNVTLGGVVVIPDTPEAGPSFTTAPDLTTSGNYTINIFDANGCTTAIVVPVEDAVELVVTPVSDITCDALGNPVDAVFSFVVNGGYTPFDIAVSHNGGAFTDIVVGGTAPFANYNATPGAGTYIFRVRDSGGTSSTRCEFTTGEFTVTDPVAPAITAPAVDIDCAGDTGTAVITVTGADTPYEIDFNGAGFVPIVGTQISFPNLTGDAGDADPNTNTTTYNFTVRSSRGCPTNGTVDVNQSEPIRGTETVVPITCSGVIGGGNTLGSITLTLDGGTPDADAASYTYAMTLNGTAIAPPIAPSFPTANQVLFDGLDFGFYTIEVTDTLGCSEIFGPFEVENIVSGFSFTPTSVLGTCPGGFDLRVDIIQGSGVDPGPPRTVPGFRVEIIGDATSIRNLGDDGTAPPGPDPIDFTIYTGLAYGRSYVILATDLATGCTYQDTFTPVPPSNPVVVITDTDPSTCNGNDDGAFTFDVSGYDPNGGTQSFTWEVLNAFDTTIVVETSGASVPATSDPQSIGPVGSLAPGTYILRVTEDLGNACPGLSAEFVITEPDPVMISFDPASLIPANSCGTRNGQVIMNTSGGTPLAIPPTADGYQYALIEDDGFGSPQTTPAVLADFPLTSNTIDLGNTARRVYIFVTDANECIPAPVPVDVTVLPLPTVMANFIDDCAYDNTNVIDVDGTGTGTLLYQLDGATAVVGSIDNNNHEFTVSTPGTYVISVTDESGCTVTNNVVVYGPLQFTASFTTVPNCDTASGTITAVVPPAEALGVLTYQLQDAGGAATGNTTGDASGVYTGVAQGTYIVQVTDNGRGTTPFCSFTRTVSIDAPIPPVLDPAITLVTCIGDTDGTITAALTAASIDTDPNVVYEYRITAAISATPLVTPTAYQTTPTFSGLDDGTYTVEVRATKPNGAVNVICLHTADYIINEPTAATVDISATTYGCTGATVNLPVITLDNFANGMAPYTISYTIDGTPTVTAADPATLDTDPGLAGIQIIANVAGDYVFTINDANSCPSVQPVETIPVFPIMTDPTVTRDTSAVNMGVISCDNGETVTVSITGGTGPFDFVETSGTLPSQLGVAAGAADNPGTVAVETNATNVTFVLPSPTVGSYSFTIFDQGTMCTIATPAYVIDPFDLIEVSAALNGPLLCNGDTTGVLNLTVLNYTGEFIYRIRNTTTLAVAATNTVAAGFTNPVALDPVGAGTYVVEVEAVDTPFCDEITDPVLIAQPALLELALVSNENANCNEGARITVRATGGTPPYTFRADDNNVAPYLFEVTTSNETQEFVLPAALAPGIDYIFSVIDVNNCTSTPATINQTATLTAAPVLNALTFVDDPCVFDGDFTIRATGTSNVPAPRTGALTFQLDGATAVPANVGINGRDFVVTTPGVYQVVALDENGCVSNMEDITIFPQLTISAAFTADPDCRAPDGAITATVTGGSDFATNSANFTFTLNGTGTDLAGAPVVIGPIVQTGAPGVANVFTGLSAGTYTISVLDSDVLPATGSGCTALSDPVVLAIPVDPVLTPNPTPVTCVNASDGTVRIDITPATANDGPYTYQLYENNGGTLAITGLAIGAAQVDDNTFTGLSFDALPAPHPTAGEYLVEVTSDSGCSTLTAFTIANATQVTASAVEGPYTCTGTTQNFPIITVTIADGTAPYSITYTTPSATSVTELAIVDEDAVAPGVQYTLTADEIGDYTFFVTDSNGCETVPVSFIEAVGPLPIMSNPRVIAGTPIDCINNVQAVTIEVTGGTLNGTFDIIETTGAIAATTMTNTGIATTTSATINLPGLPTPGSYVFEIRDQTTGCSIFTPQYDVPEYDTIEATIALDDGVTCFNTTDGSLMLTVTGHTGDYEYVVNNTTAGTSAAPVAANTATGAIPITGLAAADYTVTVTATSAPLGCDDTSNVISLERPTEIDVVVNQLRDETCDPGNDALIEVVASGGTGALSYQLETLDAGGLVTAVLVPFQTTQTTFTVDANNGPTSVEYRVVVRDANMCDESDTITVTPPVDIVLDPIAPIALLCSDSTNGVITATASGGQGVGTYFFSLTLPDGSVSAAQRSTTNMFVWSDLGPGDYIVTVSDNLNCTDDQNPVTITVPAPVTVDVITSGISCLTANPTMIEVTPGGGSGAGYEFSSDGITYQASNMFNNLPAGDYNFYVRDGNGCVSAPPSNTIQVRDPEPFNVVLDMSNLSIVCFSEATGSIDATATGGLGNYMYSLTGVDYLGAAISLPAQATSFFGDLLAGDYIYTVTSTAVPTGVDCAAIALPFSVVQPPEFEAVAVEEPISCNGETDGSITVTATGGTPPYFYSLYDSMDNAVFTFIEDDADNTPGVHTFEELPADIYRVEVEDNNGCPFTIVPVEIVEPDAIVVVEPTVTTPETCAGDMDGTATLSIIGGLPPLDPADPSYFFSLDGTNFQPVTDPANLFIDNLPGGITTIFIRDSRNNVNCELPYNIDITPGIELEGMLEQRLECPIYDYTDPANPVLSQEEQYFIDFNVDDETQDLDVDYILNGINGTPNPANNVSRGRMFEVVPGEYEGFMRFQGCEVSIGTIIVGDYTPLAIPVPEMTGNPEDPNEYQIIVTGGTQLEDDPFYTFQVGIVEGVQDVEDVTSSALSAVSYGIAVEGNIFVIRETAVYAIRVIDARGCESIGIYDLTYINIRIPNYFTPGVDRPETPDDDSYWYPRQILPPGTVSDPFFFDNMEVMVFDRYGRMLADFKGNAQGWDGLYQGKQLPSGDYWFTIILNDVDRREFTGHFTLYR